MSVNRTEAEQDDIARHIEATVFDFLAETVKTAQCPSDIVDLTIGVQAALARFMWASRAQGVTSGQLVEGLATNMANLFAQIEAAGETLQ